MNKLYLAISCSILCTVLSIISITSNESWLVDSGLILLTKTPIQVSILSTISFGLTTVSGIACSINPHPTIYVPHLFLTLAASFSEAYFGVKWTFMGSFFPSLYPLWNSSINTEFVALTQYKLKCCGFNEVSEFKNDNCTDSKKNSCLKALNSSFKQNIISAGVFLIAFFITRIITEVLFFMEIKEKGIEKRGIGKMYSRTQTQVLQQLD